MRQIVSLIKDNQAHYALVDDEDGSLIPFADLLIPDPDRFGLHESALLGTNLITALGLNGTKRPKATTISLASVPPTHRQPEPEPEALPAAPHGETAHQRRLRKQREAYHATKRTGKTGNNAQRYISIDEVIAVVNQYPEGIRLRDVVERLWRSNEGQGTDERYPNWYYTSVSNRLTAARVKLQNKGVPLPFREEDRQEPDKDGKLNGYMAKVLYPLASPAPQPEPEPERGDTLPL